MFYMYQDKFDITEKDSPLEGAEYIAPLVSLLGFDFTGERFHEMWEVFQKEWDYIACFNCGNHVYSPEYFKADNLIDLYKEINKHYRLNK